MRESCRDLGEVFTAGDRRMGLLGVVAAIQRGDGPGALAILQPWTTPTGTRIALTSATRLADAMSAVRLTLESKKRVLAVLHDELHGAELVADARHPSTTVH